MKFLNKNINKFILLIPALLLAKPAFADGGIPLWLNTAASWIIIPDLEGIGIMSGVFYIVMFIISLLMTVLLEALIMKPFFSKKTIKELFKIMLKANIYSTLVGIIILNIPVFFNTFEKGMTSVFFGPWVGSCQNCSESMATFIFFTMHFVLFLESCLVEYFVIKKYLIKDYTTLKTKIATVVANIVSYIVIFFAILFIMLIFSYFMDMLF